MRPITPLGILAERLERLVAQAQEMNLDRAFQTELATSLKLAQGLDPYLEACTTNDSAELNQLVDRTRSEDWSARFEQGATNRKLEPEMLSGHVEGQFLKMLIHCLKAKRVLEIGMFSGYSALSMAEALPEDGKVIACEIDPYAAEFAQQSFSLSPHGHKIEVRVAPAIETLASLTKDGTVFDFIFIDADKGGYSNYVNFIIEHHLLQPGGLIAIDNTLYQGEAYATETPSTNGKAIVQFNRQISTDPRLQQVLVPLRDGVTLIRLL